MQISSANIKELIAKQGLIQRIVGGGFKYGERIEASKYDLTVAKVFQSRKAISLSVIGVSERLIQEMKEVPAKEINGAPYRLEMDLAEGWTLGCGIYFIQSAETVTMPPWLSAMVVSRTSVFRAGCLLSGSIVDPGFSGNVLVRLQVPEDYILLLEQGAKVMSLIFNTIGTLDSISPGELDEFKFMNNLTANEQYDGIWIGNKVSTQGNVERGS